MFFVEQGKEGDEREGGGTFELVNEQIDQERGRWLTKEEEDAV